jgi:RNA polymerase sigma-70 factor (sigma-E family)
VPEPGVLRGVKLYEVTDDRTRAPDVITSFADLYRDQYGPMVQLAHLLTMSNSVAEELVQDAFVRVHRKWDQIEVPQAYLRTAVVNACRSHHRRRLLEKARPLHPPPEVVSLEADELWDALAALTYRQRAVLVMKFYEDMPEVDIAAALGCRPGTVKSLTSRALDQLRKVVEP